MLTVHKREYWLGTNCESAGGFLFDVVGSQGFLTVQNKRALQFVKSESVALM